MKYFLHKQYFLLFCLCVVVLYFTSCVSTRYVPEGEWLLTKNKINIDKPALASELETYIQPKPNRKILWAIPFHLYVYNLSKTGKERKWKKKIGSVVGEPPVLVNEYQIKRSKQQIGAYLKTKGYYYAHVEDSIDKRTSKKATVIYRIQTGNPYLIDTVLWESQDLIIKDYFLEAAKYTLLKQSTQLDEDLLQAERNRITEYLKNRGFYYFTRDFIQFEVDTSIGNYRCSVKCLLINRHAETTSLSNNPYRIYYIDSVFVFYNYNARQAIQNRNEFLASLDTTAYKNIYLVGSGHSMFRPVLLSRMNFIQTGDVYNQKDAQVTYEKFMSLNNFRLVNVQFVESGKPYRLNSIIQLTPLPRQSYQIEVQGTNSSGNLGIAGNIYYLNRNIFGGAQNLQIGITASIERQTAVVQENDEQIQQYLPFNAIESGAYTKVRIPSFWFPFISESFIKYKNPSTQIEASYNFQQRPDYIRTVTTFVFGFDWSGNKNLRHFVNPIELNYVKIPFISWRFKRVIRGTFLENSYENHMETISSYGFIFNDNKVGKQQQNSVFVRGRFETSGNVLYQAFSNLSGLAADTTYQILGVPFSQFVRAELDYRYYKFITKGTKLVYRVYGGVGYPYGNSKVLPFNKRYFAGGASSIRAWAVRSLGPGSTADTTNGNVFNQTGDIKLEGNLEYRFTLFWVIEPALFVDVGNVWNIKKQSENDKGYFQYQRVLPDLALGYGIGFRFNFSFFIFRTDLAFKGKDPAEPIGSRWLFVQRKMQRDDITFNVGIGYPF